MLVALVSLCVLVLIPPGLDTFNDPLEQSIMIKLKMPLVLTACFVGAALAVSSGCLQVLLRNPLADPGIIGITNGASLAAATLLLLGRQIPLEQLQYALPLCCFLGALITTITVYLVARRMPGVGYGVILAGLAISTVCGAIVAWMHLFSDAQSMRNLTFWLMGSLHQADWSILWVTLPPMAGLIVYLILQSKKLNWFYFGSTEAHLAGVDVKRFQKHMLLVCSLLIGIAVSIAGSIAFVGLLVPHILRLVFGFDNRFILPASAISGAVLLVLVSLLSETFASFSIPVSMLTATIGGPVFLLAILKVRGKES